jgi:uncharacterized protein YjiS (DUF1127 family)
VRLKKKAIEREEIVMTLNTQTLHAGGATVAFVAQRLGELGKGLWRAYRRRRAERATIATLNGLGDNVLHDIGIDRSEIESVVRTRSKGRLQRFEGV